MIGGSIAVFDSKQNRIFTIPNILSFSRPVLGLIAALFLSANTEISLWWAFSIMLVAEATDLADGIIARRFESQRSRLGPTIDPVCDSIYHLAIFVAFLTIGWIPVWVVFLIYARDIAIPYLRTFIRQVGNTLMLRASGKAKTFVHAVAQLGIVMIGLGNFGQDVFIGGWEHTFLLMAAAAISLYSLIDYALAAYRVYKHEPMR
jgi:CDP-diacylglycerol--glycerol-3-phosphate 3-phosphatidyltransferase